MSWSENAKGFARLLAISSVLLLAACQVRPLYSEGPSGKASSALASIKIADAEDRVGQDVRNRLIFLTSGGAGEPANAQYNLALKVTSDTQGVLFDQQADTAEAGRVVVRADYNLTRIDNGQTVRSGNRSAVALVDFSEQEFAKARAKIDAEKRAATELAEIIRADLAASLGR